MLDELLVHITRIKKELIEKIRNLQNENHKDNAIAHWIPYNPQKNEECNIASEDGSYNYIEYKGFVLYAVASVGFSFNNKSLTSSKNVDIDILHPYRYTEERLRFYMSILEKNVALKILHENEIDFFLLDGSILGDLIRPAAFERAPSLKEREIIIKDYISEIKSKLTNKEFSYIKSKQYVNEIYKSNLTSSINSIIYLEYLENLLTLKELLSFRDKIIGISKRSQSTSYFENPFYPDIAIFEQFCREPGFSKPMSVEMEFLDNYKRRFPILDQEIREIPLTVFYARFGKNKPVLKFEYVGKPDAEQVKHIMNKLAFSIVEGYPYLLKKAHNKVIIRNKDMAQIANILGIKEKTGREML